MKLRFDANTINTPAGYAAFVFDLNQRQLSDIFEACEAAGKEHLVYDALHQWAVENKQHFEDMPQPALAALCAVLAAPRPKSGPTATKARDAAVFSAAVALCRRFPDLPPTRNAATKASPSAASLLAEVVGRSEERINKAVKGVGKMLAKNNNDL